MRKWMSEKPKNADGGFSDERVTPLFLEQPFGLLRNVLLQPLLGDGVVVVADVAQNDLGRVEAHGTAQGTDRPADNVPRHRPQEVGLCRALLSSRKALLFHLSAV